MAPKQDKRAEQRSADWFFPHVLTAVKRQYGVIVEVSGSATVSKERRDKALQPAAAAAPATLRRASGGRK